LHVQTNNEEGLAFYRKFGFDVIRKIENYYTDIEPPDCYLLVKVLSPPVPQSSSHDCVKDI
jgi:ribosomal protein S18 acetylase RimI-like enzyme